MAYPFPQELIPANLAAWQEIRPSIHKTCDLHPTQYYLRIDRIISLADGGAAELLDIPHVVTYQGKMYLYDGHHRWALRKIAKKPFIAVRNFVIPPP